MSEIVSFSAGFVLLVISLMVMIAYRPNRESFKTGSGLLGLAIFLGFLSAALNTFWWQILGNTVDDFGVGIESFRAVGLYLDALLKGGAAMSGVLHLIAIRENLSPEEKHGWHWWQMPWYPKRRACLELIANLATWRRGGRR